MPNFYPNIYNQYPQMQAQQPQMIQDGGFVPVPNEQVARNYPVGFGKSVTFKDENSPYIYTKTMGFSQLDTPTFEKYKLVKETPSEGSNLPDKGDFDANVIISSIEKIKGEIGQIWAEIDAIKKEEAEGV